MLPHEDIRDQGLTLSDQPGRRLRDGEHEEDAEEREDTAEAWQDSPMNVLQTVFRRSDFYDNEA